ncbi:hypothetical protein ABID94_003119 [Streptomyces sp. PvR018]
MLDFSKTRGGRLGHYPDIQPFSFCALSSKQQADFTWEAPGCKQVGTTTAPWVSFLGRASDINA